MADSDRNIAQASVKTGTKVGELCAVGICCLTTGVPLCAGEPVQPDAGSLPDAESLRQCGGSDACTDTGHSG